MDPPLVGFPGSGFANQSNDMTKNTLFVSAAAVKMVTFLTKNGHKQ
jgi:hypothetical protein